MAPLCQWFSGHRGARFWGKSGRVNALAKARGFLDNASGQGYLRGMKAWLAWAVSIQTVLQWGCSSPAPTPPLEEDRFVDLYVRSARLNVHYRASPDSLRVLREKLFSEQGVRPADLERAIAWYADHPAGAVRVMERITRRMAETERQVGQGSRATPGHDPRR